jgi:CheY-like chemotaxis protein
MPVMDGFELVRQIRNMPQYEMVPIMAVTAFAGTDPAELREKLLTLGADDFIAKPLAEEDFLPVVARYLGIA